MYIKMSLSFFLSRVFDLIWKRDTSAHVHIGWPPVSPNRESGFHAASKKNNDRRRHDFLGQSFVRLAPSSTNGECVSYNRRKRTVA